MTDSKPATGAPPVRIVEFEARHREAFRALNVEWITTYFKMEAADHHALDDPEASILRPGGAILMAEEGDRIVGTVALISIAPDAVELAKMAVAPAARGKGIGFLLGRAAVERAGRMGVRRVELLTNSVLQPALRLYRRLGFLEVPLGRTEYQRADVKMVLNLESSSWGASGSPVPEEGEPRQSRR